MKTLKILLTIITLTASISSFTSSTAFAKSGNGGGWDFDGAVTRMNDGDYSMAQLIVDATLAAAKDEKTLTARCDLNWLTATLNSIKTLGAIDSAYGAAIKSASLDHDSRKCLEDAFRKSAAQR